MTLFQLVSMWTLRALVLWGALEIGGRLYGIALDRAAQLNELAGHSAAMSRLNERAQSAETAARSTYAALAAFDGEVWTLAVGAEKRWAAQALARCATN